MFVFNYRVLALLFTLAGSWACGIGATRLNSSDYDQTCLEVAQCILVDLEACSSCNCPDAAISQDAYGAFTTDLVSLEETYCPEGPEDEGSCPTCNLREPVCESEECGID